VSNGIVKTGIDVLREQGFEALRGKRVGLVTNPSGIARDMQSTADILFEDPRVQLVAMFGPEHGVRGDAKAGAYVPTYTDEKTGLPVYSLYGPTRKPSPEMLEGLDVLVYDIQDIGVRSYTYISTMGLVMEAAAEKGLPVIILDRPNPLSGEQVGGPILQMKYKSFVGAYPIPYVYGMTAGELAQMINGQGWMANGAVCDLTVVSMEGWERSMWWEETGLSWVPTSPHIPHPQTTIFYVLTGLLGELGTANQGVGYTLPFELVGAPWVDGEKLASYLNGRGITGVVFRPMWYKPFYFDSSGIQYAGVQIHVVDRSSLDMTEVQMHILQALLTLFPEWNIFERSKPNRLQSFDKVVGTVLVRKWLQEEVPAGVIVDRLHQRLAPFMIKREKYLLYD
jgi:uncharacterized protein YbbC (DUF1343 family)